MYICNINQNFTKVSPVALFEILTNDHAKVPRYKDNL